MAVVFKNNATTTLNGSITNSATSITVTSGAVFPQVVARSAITTPVSGAETCNTNQTALIHCDVANGATTFTNVSGSAVTNNGTLFSGDTTTYKFGTASAKNLTASITPALYSTTTAVGTGDFSMEGWFYPDWNGSYKTVLHCATAGNNYYDFYINPTSQAYISYSAAGSTQTLTLSGITITQNAWNYIGFERTGTTINAYINTVRGYTGTPTYNVNLNSSTVMSFGGSVGWGVGYNSFTGYMDELSFWKTAIYNGAASITPPTSPYLLYLDPTQYSSTNTSDAGDYFYATITDGTNREVVKVTNVSSNTLTVTRGQEGTSGTAFASGSTIEIRPTNQGLIDLRNDQLFREVAYTNKRYLGAN